jgi:hypothetical protein
MSVMTFLFFAKWAKSLVLHSLHSVGVTVYEFAVDSTLDKR